MSLKNNLEAMKDEFKTDEKIFESAFRLERLFKKYKYLFIIVLVVLIGAIVVFEVDGYFKQKRAIKASEIYEQLLKEPNNQSLLDALKENAPQLQELFLLSRAIKKGDEDTLKQLMQSQDSFVADFATYQLASLNQDLSLLYNVDSKGFGDLAKLQQAYLLLKQKKDKQAHEILEVLDQQSPLKEMAKIFLHYQSGAK